MELCDRKDLEGELLSFRVSRERERERGLTLIVFVLGVPAFDGVEESFGSAEEWTPPTMQ